MQQGNSDRFVRVCGREQRVVSQMKKGRKEREKKRGTNKGRRRKIGADLLMKHRRGLLDLLYEEREPMEWVSITEIGRASRSCDYDTPSNVQRDDNSMVRSCASVCVSASLCASVCVCACVFACLFACCFVCVCGFLGVPFSFRCQPQLLMALLFVQTRTMTSRRTRTQCPATHLCALEPCDRCAHARAQTLSMAQTSKRKLV